MKRDIVLLVADYDKDISTYYENILNKYLAESALNEHLDSQISLEYVFGGIGANVYFIDDHLKNGKFSMLIDLLFDERSKELEECFYDERITKPFRTRELIVINTKKMIEVLKAFIGDMTFGKYKGKRVEEVAMNNPSYFKWMQDKGMTEYPEFKRYLKMKNTILTN
ncbi:hypothetical protein [Paenibacillus sp. FSL H8-0332]|uniref:exodeoxyribonuclease X C-terminal domain-containing protein n=1 Tax=Paenibacillus sp. FSL H8-0332 TaxID=2954742 RepID=UPI0030D127DF